MLLTHSVAALTMNQYTTQKALPCSQLPHQYTTHKIDNNLSSTSDRSCWLAKACKIQILLLLLLLPAVARSFRGMSDLICSGAGNEVDISGKPPARQWIAGIYFAVMMVTTVGLGDIKACTPAEEVLASFQMLLGVFLFGLIVSTSQYVLLLLLLALIVSSCQPVLLPLRSLRRHPTVCACSSSCNDCRQLSACPSSSSVSLSAPHSTCFFFLE